MQRTERTDTNLSRVKKPSNQAETKGRSSAGKVWLVGAGPGDPELLTVKAMQTIQQADIIFYDALVSRDIRALFPPTVPALYVGKTKGHHSISQEALNEYLSNQARMGLQVCRLKGGDPFVFGRGGEELLALRRAGVNAEVIPGITAALGCSASSGIPLTHRGLSQGCTFITGHAEQKLEHQWRALVQLNHTLVFYMAVSSAGDITRHLLNADMDPNTPAALIENGCRASQRRITTSLAALPKTLRDEAIKSPALVVLGEVVELAQTLQPEAVEPLLQFQSPQHQLSA